MDKIAIIGIGNIILKDDGFGIHVIKELEKENLPQWVSLVDGGTSTLDMLSYFIDYKNIIIIDAIKLGAASGTFYKINYKDLKKYKASNMSVHDIQILDVIKMAKLMGADPNVVIYGVEPDEITYDLELSNTIKDKIPNVISYIKKELLDSNKHSEV